MTKPPAETVPFAVSGPTEPPTEPASTPPADLPLQESASTVLPPPTEPPSTAPAPTAPPPSEPPATSPPTAPPATDPPSEPETGVSDPPYQYGDTTPTWRPSLAAGYPADENCTDNQLLEKWMAVEGLTLADLEERGCDQLILVAAQPPDGVQTLTVLYARGPDGSFAPVRGRMRGWVGKNGIMHDRRRNTDTSPAGLWAISSAFGNEQPPEGLKLPWRQVTPNSDWVCDEDSAYFNTWQERDDPGLTPWSDDVEHLEDYPRHYAYACVLEFNRPPDVVPDRGCAIFLHCSEGPTGGCVGLLRADMLTVLRWLDPEKNPYILITGTENA